MGAMTPPIVLAEQPRAFHLAAATLALTVGFAAVYTLLRPFYNIFFHPLRMYPGPKSWAASTIPLFLSQISGDHLRNLLALHCQYGEIVRISPTELSYVSPSAWKDIMGHRKQGQVENGKDMVFYKEAAQTITGAGQELHSRMRKTLSHSFSPKAMQEQEPLIQYYIDLLFQRLRTAATAGKPVNMVAWYNYATFDIIGDLSFGESFGCLENSSLHPWVATIFDSFKARSLSYNLRRFFFHIDKVIRLVMPSVTAAVRKHFIFAQQMIERRVALSKSRPDFVESMMNKHSGMPLTREQVVALSSSLVAAGSETTASILSFATYFLSLHPAILARVRAEVDAAFDREEDINFQTASRLPYMLAILNETMRLFPAAPATLPRRTPPGGVVICGQFVPGNITVGIPQWTAYHYPGNFEDAEKFVPERWRNDTLYPKDKKEVFQPFSYGSRDCLGKSLAYTEMRVILARMLFNFDIELDERSKTWGNGMKTWILWKKGEMLVHLRPRPGRAV